jgi:hypothetical protein
MLLIVYKIILSEGDGLKPTRGTFLKMFIYDQPCSGLTAILRDQEWLMS